MKWAYGVTTVPSRKEDLLPATLVALQKAGFGSPRLFIDGEKDPTTYAHLSLPITCRFPVVHASGNWYLALWELYIREPEADRYAIFEDDFITYCNIREYLEAVPYPEQGYCNLYTTPTNQLLAKDTIGWYRSNQRGKGALALVFNQSAIKSLLSTSNFVHKSQERALNRRYGYTDGAIVTAMKSTGYYEYVHNPSLVQHVGKVSAIGNPWLATAVSYRGPQFDALELLS